MLQSYTRIPIRRPVNPSTLIRALNQCYPYSTSNSYNHIIPPPPTLKPFPKAYNPELVEQKWYDWWLQTRAFEPEFTADGKIKPEGLFCIPAPPPNITGALHIGHALTISIQDSLVRYYRMKGKTVLFLPGFDHAGIATQSVVEKQIWRQERKTKYDYGREEFVKKVWDWKEIYHEKIKNQVKQLGASYDWIREAFTLDPKLSSAVVEAFVRLHDEGVIYRALRLVNWSTKLSTTISNLEVDNRIIPGRTLIPVPGYEKKIEFGVLTYFAYRVAGSNNGEQLIVATTRPETIHGDTAVAIHPDDPRYIHLHGKSVQHPFLDKKLPIILDDKIVDMGFGTGAVKITPGHDFNDYEVSTRHDIDVVNILTEDGKLNSNCGPKWAGMKRFDAREKIIEDLKELGLFIKQEGHEMTIPICSRSGDIIEPMLKPQWWVSQKQLAKDAMDVIKKGEIKMWSNRTKSEYLRWLENIHDWCISRQLWWGHRCPVYFVNIENKDNSREDGNYWIAGRSHDEALIKAKKKFPSEKFTLEQDEDVLDTWFSSALWPFSTLGWPQKTKDMEQFYPFSILETGWDILFFWVTRMILLGIKLTGSVPFKEVYCHSLIRDSQGRKMSKSLGNVIDPLDIIHGVTLKELNAKTVNSNLSEKEVKRVIREQQKIYSRGIPQCGTDALRFTLCAYTTGARDINLDLLRVEGYRRFCNKIYQATNFAISRLNNNYIPKLNNKNLTECHRLVEKWSLYQMNNCAKVMNESFEERNFLTGTTAIYQYWYMICDVYIEYFKSLHHTNDAIKMDLAKDVLYELIKNGLKMIHPFMPYISEELWQRITRNGEFEKCVTITKASYPIYDPTIANYFADAQIYDVILNTTKAIRSLLSEYNIIKNGQIYISVQDDDETTSAFVMEKEALVSMIKGLSDIAILSNSSENIVLNDCVMKSVNDKVKIYLLVKGQYEDIRKEIEKNQKKLKKLEGIKENLKRTLSNSEFLKKATMEVQRINKEKLTNIQGQILGLQTTVNNLKRFQDDR
ncbi:valine--tRNA ligase NDAI_0G01260 [Naumovozyma dairenensis CBS 421]|uniref:Valine--tRNA ligase, mitochondrial n=1 Tax=Naumovozyma dairenensis (strain ATCC 10597 / BCRC 20456 / CBS 421 / NBRC 0211 / NRRL Y-12639) TaxID=1071378 RepID=G0WDP1_NAUDC|nr:hypothetical protein NDAI_0G01260 [Naumovozyma dairenensis CBS 421]CCD25902.2 hypothetical protein NDAI_0G01260 [Naumovozyma dairenensis CBS 421]